MHVLKIVLICLVALFGILSLKLYFHKPLIINMIQTSDFDYPSFIMCNGILDELALAGVKQGKDFVFSYQTSPNELADELFQDTFKGHPHIVVALGTTATKAAILANKAKETSIVFVSSFQPTENVLSNITGIVAPRPTISCSSAENTPPEETHELDDIQQVSKDMLKFVTKSSSEKSTDLSKSQADAYKLGGEVGKILIKVIKKNSRHLVDDNSEVDLRSSEACARGV